MLQDHQEIGKEKKTNAWVEKKLVLNYNFWFVCCQSLMVQDTSVSHSTLYYFYITFAVV